MSGTNISEGILSFQNQPPQLFDDYDILKCVDHPSIEQLAAQLKDLHFHLDIWQEMALMAQSEDPQKRFEGTQKFRMMLSNTGEIPIQAVLGTGVVPSLVNHLYACDDPDLQFEAAWSLTNLATGTTTQTEYVVQHNVIPAFIGSLVSPSEKLRAQCMWGIGNIAGDRAQFRDLILNETDALYKIIEALDSFTTLSSQQIGIWAISNLCRGYPRPDIYLVLPLIELLLRYLRSQSDPSLLTDACWALDGLVDNAIGMKMFLSFPDGVELVVPLLENTEASVQRPALGIVAQVAASANSPKDNLIAAGALKGLLKLLHSNRRAIRQESCWALGNISLGSIDQLPYLITCGVYSGMLHVYQNDEEEEVKKEAAWAICTAYIAGSTQHLSSLIDFNQLEIFSDMLKINDTKVLLLVIDALSSIMKIGNQKKIEMGSIQNLNPYLQLFLQTEGPSHIVDLVNHPDFKVGTKVIKFIKDYLSHLPEFDSWWGT